MRRRPRRQRAHPSAPPQELQAVAVDPARPWAVLGLVNEWVRHAETKAGAVLAAAGIVGTALYNLLEQQSKPPWTLVLPASLCGLLTALTGVLAVLAVWPVLRPREAPTSLLYFDHIARAFSCAPCYGQALHRLVTHGEDELQQVAQQVWANAVVARRKYHWAGRALVSLVGAIATLGWTGTYLALKSIGFIGG